MSTIPRHANVYSGGAIFHLVVFPHNLAAHNVLDNTEGMYYFPCTLNILNFHMLYAYR